MESPTTRYGRKRSRTNVVTMAEVAQAAGVSQQTVSRALRRPGEVSEEVLVRVRSAIDAVGYVPNLTASNLASNKSMTVAAVIPLLSSSVFGETMQGAQEVLDEAGYQIIVGCTGYVPEREERVIRNLLGRRPDGVLIVGTEHTDNSVRLLRQARVPVVETWDWTSDPIDVLVGFSNRDAFASLTLKLSEKGYRRPVFAGVIEPGDRRAVARREGFIATANMLWPEEAPRVLSLENRPLTMEAGAEALREIRTRFLDADIILFSSDIFASGAILAAPELGVRVPKDIAIVGFGDYEIASRVRPRLSTVAVHAHDLGTESAVALLRRMQGAKVERQTDLGYSIIFRESC